MLKFKRITVDDIDLLKGMVLRKADINELITGTGFKDIFKAIRYCITHSVKWTEICYDPDTKEVITLFGLGKLDDSCGIPWMIASPTVRKHKKLLMRYSRKVIREMFKEFNMLANFVDSRNLAHIHWLKHMGFIFDSSLNTKIDRVPFLYFYKFKE